MNEKLIKLLTENDLYFHIETMDICGGETVYVLSGWVNYELEDIVYGSSIDELIEKYENR